MIKRIMIFSLIFLLSRSFSSCDGSHKINSTEEQIQSKIDFNTIEGIYTYVIDSPYVIGDGSRPPDTATLKTTIDPVVGTQVIFDKQGNGVYTQGTTPIVLTLMKQNGHRYIFRTTIGYMLLELRKENGRKILVRDSRAERMTGPSLESIENNRFLPGDTVTHFELDLSYYL